MGPRAAVRATTKRKIWRDFHISEDSSRVGRYAVSTGERLPPFRRIIVSSSYRVKQTMDPLTAVSIGQHSPTFRRFIVLHLEDQGVRGRCLDWYKVADVSNERISSSHGHAVKAIHGLTQEVNLLRSKRREPFTN